MGRSNSFSCDYEKKKKVWAERGQNNFQFSILLIPILQVLYKNARCKKDRWEGRRREHSSYRTCRFWFFGCFYCSSSVLLFESGKGLVRNLLGTFSVIKELELLLSADVVLHPWGGGCVARVTALLLRRRAAAAALSAAKRRERRACQIGRCMFWGRDGLWSGWFARPFLFGSWGSSASGYLGSWEFD